MDNFELGWPPICLNASQISNYLKIASQRWTLHMVTNLLSRETHYSETLICLSDLILKSWQWVLIRVLLYSSLVLLGLTNNGPSDFDFNALKSENLPKSQKWPFWLKTQKLTIAKKHSWKDNLQILKEKVNQAVKHIFDWLVYQFNSRYSWWNIAKVGHVSRNCLSLNAKSCGQNVFSWFQMFELTRLKTRYAGQNFLLIHQDKGTYLDKGT